MTRPLGHLDRFGVVVGDLDAAMAAYARVFGIRRFDLCRLDGRPVALGSSSTLRLERVEGNGGNDVVGQFSDRRGEGVRHAVFAPQGAEGVAALIEQAAAGDVPVVVDGDRACVSRRADFGDLALPVQSAPRPVVGQRHFN